MSIEKKSIVEEALLQIKAVEEAISENAKGILASTMREEISELVKESLGGSKNSKNTKRSLYEQEEVPVDMEDEIDDTDGTDGDVEDLDVNVEDEDDTEVVDPEFDIMASDDNEDEVSPLDMTGASPQEVLKVFRAMGDEDGIIVKKEGSLIKLTDNDTDKDYIIQTESDYRRKRNMKSKLNEREDSRFENLDDIDFSEYRKPSRRDDETVYDLEIGHDDDEDEDDEDETVYDLEVSDDRPFKKYSMMDESEEDEDDEYEEEDEDEDEDELEESFKPKGKVGKMKFTYPKSMKKGVTETSNEDEDLDENWDLEEGEELVSYPASPTKEMGEGMKPKGNVGKMKFSYPKSMKKGVTETSDEDEEGWEDEEEETGETTEASRTMTYKRRAEKNRVTAPRQVRSESAIREMSLLREKNEEYRKALDFFRNKLNEVAVFNSNLAYSTRLFTEHSTTKQEKINILRRFDNIESLKESKNLYKSIKGELDGKVTEVVTESIQRKVNKTPQTGSASNLIESKTYENPQFMRMKDLMTKIK